MIRLFHPEIFQGSKTKKNYFEGWYFKHVSHDNKHVISIIPGISLNAIDSHSFIQVIDGVTGFTRYIQYPVEQFVPDKKHFNLALGKSRFSMNEVNLDIEDDHFSLKGKLQYKNLHPYPSRFMAPGIMGWYTFVPFMECYHGVVSVNHDISGHVMYNNKNISFENGKGYIEKDWGKSFPESWIWLQCNSFTENDASLMISVAKIPWLGHYFLGFISFLYYNGDFYQFSTYNNSQIQILNLDENSVNITVKNKNHVLNVHGKSKKSGILAAPVSGAMTRRIKESVDAEVTFQLYDINHNMIIEDNGKRAGLEIIETIVKYLT